jgi:agmatine deiminase
MSKKSVKVAVIQTKASVDMKANLENAVVRIKQAAERGAKIICLPELYRTIYFPQKITKNFDKYSETIPGESTAVFSKLAKELKIIIIVPLFEKAKNGHYYNSAAVINEAGKLLSIYRKIHIPHDPLFYEQSYFKPGDTGYKIYKTKYAAFAVLICYDQWFPEAARMAALAGAEIIFYPTAIGNVLGYKPAEGDWHDAWETIQRSHAIANSVYVVAANRVGVENKLNFWGQSFITDAFGKVLKRASSSKEEIITAELNLAEIKTIRDGWGFFRNRRPNTYK